MGLLYQQTTATMLCDVPKMTELVWFQMQDKIVRIAFFLMQWEFQSPRRYMAPTLAFNGGAPQRFERTLLLGNYGVAVQKLGQQRWYIFWAYCGRWHGTIAIGTYGNDGRRALDLNITYDVEICHERMIFLLSAKTVAIHTKPFHDKKAHISNCSLGTQDVCFIAGDLQSTLKRIRSQWGPSPWSEATKCSPHHGDQCQPTRWSSNRRANPPGRLYWS